MGKHNEFGKLGEQLAVDFLIKNGYRILDRNYRYQKAEVDIIARKGDILSVIEVKSRTANFLKDIAETVNQKKINLLILAADNYIQERNLTLEVQFDIITVIKKQQRFEIDHLKNAFYFF